MHKRIQKHLEKRVRYIDYTADRQKEQLYKPNGKSLRVLSVVQSKSSRHASSTVAERPQAGHQRRVRITKMSYLCITSYSPQGGQSQPRGHSSRRPRIPWESGGHMRRGNTLGSPPGGITTHPKETSAVRGAVHFPKSSHQYSDRHPS